MQNLNKMYDQHFYNDQMSGSYKSAKTYAGILSSYMTLKSIADVGCGRGTWLKAFSEHNADRLVGFDGDWNTQNNMVSQNIEYIACDLNQPIKPPSGETFDLAMSLEVAEHLQPSSAETFVASLTGLADVILFGAAYTAQGGRNHINEQPATYWAVRFAKHNYVPFDLFRPVVWGNPDVEFWYQQNTFLYVRQNYPTFETLMAKGARPMSNPAFMDCVHPLLYVRKLR